MSVFLPLLRANFSRVSVFPLSSWPLLISRFQRLNSHASRITRRHSLMLLSSLCLSLSHLHLPLCPSIHPSIQLLRGRALRFSVSSPFPPLIACEGESYGGFEQDSGCYMLSLAWVCVCARERLRSAFPPELTKIPPLSHKVSVHHTDERQRKRDPREKMW